MAVFYSHRARVFRSLNSGDAQSVFWCFGGKTGKLDDLVFPSFSHNFEIECLAKTLELMCIALHLAQQPLHKNNSKTLAQYFNIIGGEPT
jgi:hypothetical protein